MESRPGTPLGRCEPTVEHFIIYTAPLLSPTDDSHPHAEDPELATPKSSPTSLCFPAQDPGAVPTTPTPTSSQPSSLRPLPPGYLSESYDTPSPEGKRKTSTPLQAGATFRNTQAFETPEKRVKSNSSLSAASKYRTNTASQKATLKQDNDGRLHCVVTRLQDDMLPLQFSHVVPISTSSEVLTKLEWAWDMGHGYLNLHSRYNIQILTQALHTLFDHRTAFWFWVPTNQDLVNKIHSRYVGVKKEVNGRFKIKQLYPSVHCFEYALIAPKFLHKSFAFFRFQGESPDTPADKANSITYEPISPVELHLSPQFVIYDIGRKLQARYGALAAKDIRACLQDEVEFTDPFYLTQVIMCYEIYNAWMGTIPSAEFSKTEMPTTTFSNLTSADFAKRYIEVAETPKKGSNAQ